MKRAAVVIVGRGRVAGTLLPALTAAGYRTRSLGSRSPDRINASAIRALDGATIVLLAVPDSAILEVAAGLARSMDGWESRVVLHHAGAFGPEALAPLARKGASVGVLHPLQSLADPKVARGTLRGSWARIEGDPRAAGVARRLARDLGLQPLRRPAKATPASRAAYHAAASLVGNDLLALLDGGASLMEEIGARRKEALSALIALARGVLANVEALGLERAITGPVARGDAKTLAAQLARMQKTSPELTRVHRELSRALLRIAARSRTLPPRALRDLNALLADNRSAGPRRTKTRRKTA